MGAGVNFLLLAVLAGDLPTFCPGKKRMPSASSLFLLLVVRPSRARKKAGVCETPAFHFTSATPYQQKRQR